MSTYDFRQVEEKWQKIWDKEQSFKAEDISKKPKYYVLSEFFGPSGKGIHLGHVKCFTPTEVVARYKRLKGYNVLYPVGWDAFGLPTENYALKMKKDPELVTEDNIKIFTNQLKKLGYSFDWSREVCTSKEDYYKWTQWIFLQLHKNGMAYKSEGVVNFCPQCQTVLSNEDSQGGICDRCKSTVEEKTRSVWYLRMKDYSEKMLEAIEEIDMKPSLKESQRNWIGKSEGAEVEFKLEGSSDKLKVFTTRPDTLYGVTFMVVAPEHSLIEKNAIKITNMSELNDYISKAKAKSSIERSANKDKSGVQIKGVYAINPINNKKIPVYVADYVMMGYGTGAIMAVPAHDERDYEFATKFGIEIIQVISGGDISKSAYTGDGKLINSELINGLNVAKAKKTIIDYLVKNNIGVKHVNYKMQDWPFNRQRYWGEPFPIVCCDKCGHVGLDKKELPLALPKLKDYSPDSSGNGPLAKDKVWGKVKCPKCGKDATRETDTMPNWAGSSWYWLRFIDPKNDKEFVSQDKLKYWGAVDLYTGGTEHVTRHMLYASFWHNFLHDIKAVPHKLPFTRRMCNGLILDDTGRKMGKSSGNSIDPIQVIDEFGADAFRMHILFMGDYELNTIWSLDGISGCTSFLKRLWSLQDCIKGDEVSKQHEKALHTLIKKADTGIIDDKSSSYEDKSDFKFNTVIAGFMEFMNVVRKSGYISKEELRQYLVVMNPFIPHITSELYENVFGKNIVSETFPTYDESKLVESNINLPVQLAGKLKGTIKIELDQEQTSVEKLALELLKLSAPPKKIIYIKNKIINVIP